MIASTLLSVLAFVYPVKERIVDLFLDAPDSRVAIERVILTVYQDHNLEIEEDVLCAYVDGLKQTISRYDLVPFLEGLDKETLDVSKLVFEDREFLKILEVRAILLNNYLSIVREQVVSNLSNSLE